MELAEFLNKLGLSQYLPKLALNDVDEAVLPLLKTEDLEAMGVASLGHRRLILEAAANLRRSGGKENETLPEHAERRLVTMMFCDLAGYSSLAESLDPEDLQAILERFRALCRQTVSKYRGTIVNFMGDGIMAAFGYPASHSNDAARAVDAALELVQAIETLETPSGDRLLARAGLNSGTVVVGELADKTDTDRIMVIGTPPNRAARIQSLAEAGEVLLSENTRRLCRGRHAYEDRQSHVLKGIEEPVHVWRAHQRITPNTQEHEHPVPNTGRDAEFGRLNNHWSKSLDGQGGGVLVTGEAGLGKSRLISAFHEKILGRGAEIVEFSANASFSDTAYHTLSEYVIRISGVGREDAFSDRQSKIASALGVDRTHPELSRLAHLTASASRPAAPGEEPPAGFKAWYFDVLRNRLMANAAGKPLLVILQDAHWADPTSMEFFFEFSKWAQGHSALLVIQSRPEAVETWPETASLSTIELKKLDSNEIEAIVAALPDAQDLSNQQLKQITKRADGNPFFALELARTLEAEASTIPDTLLETLSSRIDQSGNLRQFVLNAACIGAHFDVETLSAITGSERSRTRDALMKLCEHRIIQTNDDVNLDQFHFRHALLQEAAYEMLLRKQKRTTHERIANRLAEQKTGTPAVVARHYQRAGMPVEAARWWYASAEDGLAVGGYAEVLSVLREARDALGKLPDKSAETRRLEIQVLTALGSTLLTTAPQVSNDIKEAYDAAFALTLETEGAPETGPVLFGLAVYYFFRGELSRTQKLCEQLVGLAQKLGADEMAGGATLMSHQAEFWRGNLKSVLSAPALPPSDLKPEAGQLARYAQDPQITSRITHIWALNLGGRHDEAKAEVEWAMRYARDLNHPFTLAQACQAAGWHHICRGDVDAARGASDEMLDLTNRHGMFMLVDFATIQSLWAKAHQKKSRNAHLEMAEIIDRWIMTEAHLAVRMATALAVDIAILEGDLEFGYSRARAALAMTQSEDRVYNPMLRLLLARVLAGQGAPDNEVSDAFQKAISISSLTGNALTALAAATHHLNWAKGSDSRNALPIAKSLEKLVSAYPQPGDLPIFSEARNALGLHELR